MMAAVSTVVHVRSVGAVAAAAAAGQIDFGAVGSVVSGLAALAAVLVAVLGSRKAAIEKAEQRGREARDDEVRQLKNDLADVRSDLTQERNERDYYRRKYDALVERMAGGASVTLLPSERPHPRRDEEGVS